MDTEDVRKLGPYDTVPFKTLTAACSSFVIGGVAGAVNATWRDVPAVERNVAMPALVKTARIMQSTGFYFAAIGGTFALVDAVAQEVRGTKDVWNGVLGGIAAGGIVGLRANSIPVAVGAAAALAAVSAIVDSSGQTTRIPTGREYLPYRPDLGPPSSAS